ncbi:helix-turn-helix domain-containing protein [Microbispora sp. NPDC004025]
MTDSTDLDPEAVRIGATIRALRNALGWTITELAAAVGKSHAYICNIEAGRKRCPGKLARQIAEALGVPVGAIVSPGYDTEAITAEAKSA